MTRPQTNSRFQEEILRIMDRKHHWAWPSFADGTVSVEQLTRHFQQEYAVYVRDFPVMLARIHGHNPPAAVRRMLAENIYEEDTGGLSLGKSHPELFLQMMAGLGLPAKSFERITLLPAARRYRAWLDRASYHRQWIVGAAALTVFVKKLSRSSNNTRWSATMASRLIPWISSVLIRWSRPGIDMTPTRWS
jgi:pyrroloquinoline-quinone synthase